MNVEEKIGVTVPKVDPKKAYAIRFNSTEVEIFREFNTMSDAERLWKDIRWSRIRDFATVSGSYLIEILQSRKLVQTTTPPVKK